MDELNQAYAWLKWEVDRQRNSVVPTKGKSGPELVAAVFNAVLAQSSPRRDVLIVENTFREYLASAGADGPAVMGACLNRGWIEPVADNGKRRRLRVDETRLAEDAEEFGGDDSPRQDWFKTEPPPDGAWHNIPITDNLQNLAKIVGYDYRTLQAKCVKGTAWVRKLSSRKFEMYARNGQEYAKFNGKQKQLED